LLAAIEDNADRTTAELDLPPSTAAQRVGGSRQEFGRAGLRQCRGLRGEILGGVDLTTTVVADHRPGLTR